QRAVVGDPRMIERGVKSEVRQRDSAAQRQAGRLDAAIEVLVIDRVFIMPDAGGWIRYFVGQVGAAIDAWCRLDRVNGRSRPGVDGRNRPHGGADGPEGETGRAGD